MYFHWLLSYSNIFIGLVPTTCAMTRAHLSIERENPLNSLDSRRKIDDVNNDFTLEPGASHMFGWVKCFLPAFSLLSIVVLSIYVSYLNIILFFYMIFNLDPNKILLFCSVIVGLSSRMEHKIKRWASSASLSSIRIEGESEFGETGIWEQLQSLINECEKLTIVWNQFWLCNWLQRPSTCGRTLNTRKPDKT